MIFIRANNAFITNNKLHLCFQTTKDMRLMNENCGMLRSHMSWVRRKIHQAIKMNIKNIGIFNFHLKSFAVNYLLTKSFLLLLLYTHLNSMNAAHEARKIRNVISCPSSAEHNWFERVRPAPYLIWILMTVTSASSKWCIHWPKKLLTFFFFSSKRPHCVWRPHVSSCELTQILSLKLRISTNRVRRTKCVINP